MFSFNPYTVDSNPIGSFNDMFSNYNDVLGDLPGISEFDQDINNNFWAQLLASNTQNPDHAYLSGSNRNPSEFIPQAAPSPLISDKSSILVSLDMDISYNHKNQVVLEKGSWAPGNGWSSHASNEVDTGTAVALDTGMAGPNRYSYGYINPAPSCLISDSLSTLSNDAGSLCGHDNNQAGSRVYENGWPANTSNGVHNETAIALDTDVADTNHSSYNSTTPPPSSFTFNALSKSVIHDSGSYRDGYNNQGVLNTARATGERWFAQTSDYTDSGTATTSDTAGTSYVDTTSTYPTLSPSAPRRKSRKRSKTTDDRVHQCSKCSRTSNRAYNMNQHELTHKPNRVKGFVCHIPRCPKSFSRNSDLTRHLHETELHSIDILLYPPPATNMPRTRRPRTRNTATTSSLPAPGQLKATVDHH